jgi:hypothetical protein
VGCIRKLSNASMLKRYVLFLDFIIFASCIDASRPIPSVKLHWRVESAAHNNRTNHAEADPSVAYLGREQLVQLASPTFLTTPSLKKTKPDTPYSVSPVADLAMIQFNKDERCRDMTGWNPQFGRQDKLSRL